MDHYFSSTMAPTLSHVVANTGYLLIGMAPKLALTCREFYRFRVLRRLGARPCCLKDVTRPADGYSRVKVAAIAAHVPALEASAARLASIRWDVDVSDLRDFLALGTTWPSALMDVEVRLPHELRVHA